MSVDGLEIYEGGLKVYSDAADGWYNGVKDPLYTWEPYGGIASPYPYIAAVDSGLRLSAAFGHFWLVDTEGSFVSTAIEGNTIRFGQATNAVSVGDFLPTEHAVYTHNSQAIMGMLGDTDAFSVCAKSSQNTPAYVLFNSFVDDSYYTATNQVRVGINNANPNTALDVVGGITTSGEFNLGDAKFIEVGVKGEASYGFDITI
jgi:hypothetical protein